MISKSGEYALRAMVYLAREEGRRRLAREIGDDLSIPAHFLGKVLGTLTRAGLLDSQRGRAGGFRLARPGRLINLCEIVEPFDRMSSGNRCLLGHHECSPMNPCPLHDEWPAIRGRLIERLLRTSLADLVKEGRPGGFPWRPAEGGRAKPVVPRIDVRKAHRRP